MDSNRRQRQGILIFWAENSEIVIDKCKGSNDKTEMYQDGESASIDDDVSRDFYLSIGIVSFVE